MAIASGKYLLLSGDTIIPNNLTMPTLLLAACAMIANGFLYAWDYSSRESESKGGREREERGPAKPGGSCYPTLKS